MRFAFLAFVFATMTPVLAQELAAGFPVGQPAIAFVPITHVIIIVQENRSFDNLFQSLPGANTQNYGLNSSGAQVSLTCVPLTNAWGSGCTPAPSPTTSPNGYDIDHTHSAGFEAECNNGTTLKQCPMNGFNNATCNAVGVATCPPSNAAYGYVPQVEVSPYYQMAQTWAIDDYTFQSNQGPSFTAHQFLIRATSQTTNGGSFETLDNPSGSANGSCDFPSFTVDTINPTTGAAGTAATPCFTVTSLFSEMDTAGVSWKYYQNGTSGGLWQAPNTMASLCPTTPCNGNAEYQANVSSPPSNILTDITNCALPQISFVTPTALASDHAGSTDGSGSAWVASIVDAIGQNTCPTPYWNNTAIFVTWDDWGGWYDHVPPPMNNYNAQGFRVPLLAISAYAKQNVVVHTQYDSNGSILRTLEAWFNLPSLGGVDATAPDVSDMFCLRCAANPFTYIVGALPTQHWVAMKRDDGPPDY